MTIALVKRQNSRPEISKASTPAPSRTLAQKTETSSRPRRPIPEQRSCRRSGLAFVCLGEQVCVEGLFSRLDEGIKDCSRFMNFFCGRRDEDSGKPAPQNSDDAADSGSGNI